METATTFKEACALLKQREKGIIGAVDKLTGLVLVLSPIALGPQALPALTLLGTKNELFKTLQAVMKKLLARKNDPAVREQRLAAAFCITCYAAFFEELDETMELIRNLLGAPEDRALQLNEAGLHRLKQAAKGTEEDEAAGSLDATPLALPHPAQPFSDHLTQLETLYTALSTGLMRVIVEAESWSSASEDARAKAQVLIEGLSSKAQKRFQSLYLQLATTYEEFFIWSNLQEHAATRKRSIELTQTLQAHLELTKQSKRNLDIGLAKLGKAVDLLPARLAETEANEVLTALGKAYTARNNQPIIEERGNADEGASFLRYPTKADIFVPQAYRAIRYSRKRSLEDEAVWVSAKTHENLGAFLLSFLSSPYSLEAPLLLLGHPGSGKSLLTEILAARLLGPAFTPIRVELRDSDAENEIQAQIEEQIKKDTGRDVSWSSIASYLECHPPLVIFDGYDELLQASGKVFANYLVKVREFQRREAVQGRPVRALVTSRITLIDKAIVPDGSTVVRLAPFDEARRKRWIAIWNKHNAPYFAASKTRPFRLPDDSNVVPLAEQPLLLLMLALYDSEENALADSGGLDRTRLYASLIERFIVREREKEERGEVWASLSEREQRNEVDRDMERLGAAALGMFNRRNLYIMAGDLNDDLRFFQLEREVANGFGARLSQADLLLGSFFFVQESRSGSAATGNEVGSAFEFLHNTFGEFLTADFILRASLNEASAVDALGESSALKYQLMQKLESAEGLPAAWYVSLMYTPLFSRPVILRMMTEWFSHFTLARGLAYEKLLASLDLLIQNEVQRLVATNAYPSIMLKDVPCPCGSRPLPGYAAVYTVNLVLLRVAVDPAGRYVFDESFIRPFEEGVRPWDRLTHLWRSWFSTEGLKGLADLIATERSGNRVTVQMRSEDPRLTFGAGDRLRSVTELGRALADNFLVGLGSLALYDAVGSPLGTANEVVEILAREGLDLEFRLLVEASRRRDDPVGRREQVLRGLELLQRDWMRWPTLALELLSRASEVFNPGGISRYASPFSPSFFVRELPYMVDLDPDLVDAFIALLDPRDRVVVLSEVADRLAGGLYAHPEAVLGLLRVTPELLLEANSRPPSASLNRLDEAVRRVLADESTLQRLAVSPGPMFELLRLAKVLMRPSEYERLAESALSMADGTTALMRQPGPFIEFALAAGRSGDVSAVRAWLEEALTALSRLWWEEVVSDVGVPLLQCIQMFGFDELLDRVGPPVLSNALEESFSWNDVPRTMQLVRVIRGVPGAHEWFFGHFDVERSALYRYGSAPFLRNPIWQSCLSGYSQSPRASRHQMDGLEAVPIGYIGDLRWLLQGLLARGHDPERVAWLEHMLDSSAKDDVGADGIRGS